MPFSITRNSEHSNILRYGCVLASVALATQARHLLTPALGNQFPYFTLFLAVLLIARYGGFGPAAAGVVLGAFSLKYFLISPGDFTLQGLAFYLIVGFGIAELGRSMRNARRRAEAGAQAAQRQAALIDQTFDAVLAWDWNGPITFWNCGAERLYGYPRSEALTRVSRDLLCTQTPGGVQAFVSALERDGSWEGELEQSTRDDRKLIVESRMMLVREADRTYVLESNRDITVRKQVEAELSEWQEHLETRARERTEELAQANELRCETEERFCLMVAGVKDYAIFMLDPLGKVVSWNAGAERIKSFHAGEIIGQHFSRFYPQEDIVAGKPEKELRTAIADGQSEDEGWRLRRDGTRFWAKVLITPIYDENGLLRGFSKITRDMTQQRIEEAALKESQARFGGIINSAMDAIISINEEQRIILFNASAEKMFRCPAATALGQSIDIFVPTSFREKHRDHFGEFDGTGATSRPMYSLGTLEGLRQDGEQFPIEASFSQLEVAGQKMHTVILRDITERQRAQDALQQSQAHLQAIVEHLDEGVTVSSLSGELLHFNRAALNVYGFVSVHDCRRQLSNFPNFFDLRRMDGRRLPEDEWPLARILRGETLRDVDVRIHRIQGGWQRIFSYGGTLVRDAAGQPQMAVVTLRDITEDHRAAEEIRELNEELEQRVAERTVQLQVANKELEAFTYSVSHDLRAPLRAIDGFSEALLEDYGPQLPEEAQRHLKTVREGAQRMGDLIDALLKFARLNRQELNKRDVDATKLVRETVEELSLQQEGRQVEIRVADLLPCRGDEALLRRVWVNLLSNSLKYTCKRERAVIEVGCKSEDGRTVYFVRDNGTGFDMKYAHKLFGVFQRLHLAEDFEGTGVGLAIVQSVVHRHGGRVWAEAAVDRGATFYFTLEGEQAA
jgi:PAS domain S-box-containing protein